MKVVLDTNVLVAALATRGLCQAVYELCLVSHQIVLSHHILHEVARACRTKLRLPAARTKQILALLEEQAMLVDPTGLSLSAAADPDDLPVLATAVVARADVLITGDAMLLAIGTIEGIPIMNPRQWWEQLRRRP